METSKLRKRMPVSTLFDPKIVVPAIGQAFVKLNPATLIKNPVIFVLEVVTALTTVLLVRDLVQHHAGIGFTFQIVLWLWFTVLFANFAEAVAEGRGKAQADTLRKTRTETRAKRILMPDNYEVYEGVSAEDLEAGDLVVCEAGDVIPGDGDVIEGIASVNEAAITGESAPVIRESGGDRSAVTGGTTVISDRIVIRITSSPGSSFLDRMIKLVEGAERQKTPNEIALNILLVGLTIIFVFATATIPSYATYAGGAISVVILVALFVTLIPTTIGALLSAIGIAGMDRLVRFNVLAMSGRAVEAAGDVDTLLLDKTGTVTFGNRLATEIIPVPGVTEREAAEAALLASDADETAEGRSIITLVQEKYNVKRQVAPAGAKFIAFSATTRLSGVDIGTRKLRKGAIDSVLKFAREQAGRQRCRAAGVPRRGRQDRALRRHAARPGRRRPHPRRHPPEGRGEAGREGALRRAAPHGHQDRDDHRRQSGDGGGDRLGSRRRRFHRPGDARGQAALHPQRTDAGPADRHVRRRHQRRAGAGAGRCRRLHADRHAGRARGRQHGRSRFRPDQADRGGRDRQAAADDARRAHHVLDRQRRGEIFRHHPGDLRRVLSATGRAQRHAAGHAAERDPVGDHLQRADHHRAHSAGAEGRRLSPDRRRPRCCGATC